MGVNGCQHAGRGSDLDRTLDDVITYILLTVRRVLIACRHSQPQLPTRGFAVFLCLPAISLSLPAEDGARLRGVYR
jgi:hypothetical protein